MHNKVICITGPTGIGKTKISVEVAQKFNGEIINADASQVYKYLDIGTAKITKAETNGIVHHLFDICNPDEDFSIKVYQKLANELISNLQNKDVLPFLVGGSGLYIKAVLQDYNLEGPVRDPNFENKFLNFSNEELHELLQSLDSKRASKIHPNNRRRVLRALELIELDDGNESKSNKDIYDSLVIVLDTDRDVLYDRINKRAELMFQDGWIEEAIKLKEMGYDLNKVNGIGYKEIDAYLNNELTYEELVLKISQQQRRYAKRQITWNNNQFDGIKVYVNYENIDAVIKQIEGIIIDFLKI